jgi:hypothetical protein
MCLQGFWNTIDLDGIEPFIVLFQEQDLFSFGGVELKKKQMQLDTHRGIFGLLLLCTSKIRVERSILFEAF